MKGYLDKDSGNNERVASPLNYGCIALKLDNHR